jgi:hypothetical protein
MPQLILAVVWLLLKTPPYQTPPISESKIGLVLVTT